MDKGASISIDMAPGARIIGAHGSTVETALAYETKRNRGRRSRHLDAREKLFAERVLNLAGEKSHVLDVPCGTGRFAPSFLKSNRLTMIDMAPNMMAVARNKVHELDHVNILLGDIRNLPLNDNAVDLGFCMRLFHHIPDNTTRHAILKEMARVCSKYVAFSFYNGECFRYQWRMKRKRHVRGQYISAKEMSALCRQAGLLVVTRSPLLNI
ncbi:class I SAM-dependent methyltransferase, partial [Thermodesulfobacteriota bacterium]